MENGKQPLLSSTAEESRVITHNHRDSSAATAGATFTFRPGTEDIGPISGGRDLIREFFTESKKLWYLAGPAIFTALCRYSLGAVTQVFAGHVGALELAAVSVANSVIAGFSFGVTLGMGSALETLCGQAYGAGQLDMLDTYLQRSWIILNSTALLLSLLYIFAAQILRAIGQTEAILEKAGMFAIWMIPQLFAYAMNFPIAKFLQSQSKIMVMAAIAGVVLVIHTVMSWLLIIKLGCLGMGSALETLCGQAYGAGQLDMLGIYLQRSWIILNSTALLLSLLYIFAAQILRAIGQTEAISEKAGMFAIWMIPQLFAYAMNFPIAKFLQSQSKIMVMAAIAGVVLVIHTVMSWLLIIKLGWGLVGAAVVLNASWWTMVLAQFAYIVSGTCGRAWSGFSMMAFQNLWGFVKLSLASAVMICLEVWYFMALILFAGYLKNAEISVDALSICMNILGWTIMMAFGMNAAISIRVSNELGAGHPRTAKFALVVAVITSFMIGLVISIILISARNEYPSLFSSDASVDALVKELTPVLALCIVINNVQPVFSGVAVGAGWQATVAYVNIICYYVIGVPLGLIMGFKLNFGVRGIWYGMLCGTVVQTCVLFFMVYRTNWNKEASIAEDRIRNWENSEANETDNRG